MSAASPSPPTLPLTPSSLSHQQPALTRVPSSLLPPSQQVQRPRHALMYCMDGTFVTKHFESFEAVLTDLAALALPTSDGALPIVDQVEIKFYGERLREQQCEALASRIACRIPLKNVSFDCNYYFDLNTRIWEPKVAEALIGDTGLMALLDSIGKNQNAHIQTLVLKNCNIGYLGMQALEIGLRKPQFKTLQTLNIKMNPSIGSNIARLGQQLQFKTLPSLTELNLSDCNLNIQGGIVMSRVFPGMTGLKKLNLDHCKIELVSLVGTPSKSDGLGCLTGLKALEVAGNCLLDSIDASYTGATKQDFFDNLARLASLETLNLENCRLQTEGIQLLSKQCLCKLTQLTSLNVSVNGLVSLSDEDNLEECFADLGNGIRHLKNLMSIKFNQGGFSREVAQGLCQAIVELPRPMYSYVDNSGQKRFIEGPVAIDVNYCGPDPPLTELSKSDLPRLMWWDDGNADKWRFWYELKNPKGQQKSNNKLGSQLMTVVEAMRGRNFIREAYIHHHNTMAQWHDALASCLEFGDEAQKHKDLADFHREKSASSEHFHEQANPERQLDIYEHMIKNPKHYNMLDDVHWPLHCGIQEYFADEVIEHEIVGEGGYGLVKKVTILRNRSVLNEQFCMKTLLYPTQATPSEIAKRNQLHTEIRCMAKFIRKEVCSSSEVKNGHISLRQGEWFQFEGQSRYTSEFLTNFYCCRKVERSKMPRPREWQLDLFGKGTCGPFAGPQCKDCVQFQSRYCPQPFEDHGYKNLMPVYDTNKLNPRLRAGVMFKPDPDNFEFEAGKTTSTGQTFSLIMKYLKYGSLMQRLDAGLAKSRESAPILRCSHSDWKDPEKMFIGVDDWELKLHLALGIARGIHAMHTESVWHRDLKSSNVLINEYHPSQDVLAIAAAREFGVYPYDLIIESKSSQVSISVTASTPRIPDSPIKDVCKRICISDECSDHADSLYSYLNSKDWLLDSNDDCVAAACVFLAEQANEAGFSCSIDIISSAFNCTASDVTRLSTKIRSLFPNPPSEAHLDIPVFYACVCDFGLSKPSGHSDSTDNDEKGSLPYMAPEIFEKRCKHKHSVNTPMASTPVAATPLCATPSRMSASASQPAVTPGAQLLIEQEAQKNKHRDIWAFGCVLYELATHRRPWYHKMPSASTTLQSSGAESLCGDSKLPQTQPDLHLFFLRTFWKKLGKFHGGFYDGDDALELKFSKDRRIPPCLLEAIRLCTQRDPEQRPRDIQIVIKELEKFSSIGSKRDRDKCEHC